MEISGARTALGILHPAAHWGLPRKGPILGLQTLPLYFGAPWLKRTWERAVAPRRHPRGWQVPGWQAMGTAGLSILLAPTLSRVCSEDTLMDEGAALLCMQTRAIREGWQGHFGDKARIQNNLD